MRLRLVLAVICACNSTHPEPVEAKAPEPVATTTPDVPGPRRGYASDDWSPDMPKGGPYIVEQPKIVPVKTPMKVSGAPHDRGFWAQFVGTKPSERSAEFAALCARGGRDAQAQVIGAYARIEVDRAARSCRLLVGDLSMNEATLPMPKEEQAAVAALDAIVKTWGKPDISDLWTTWIDRKRSLDVRVSRDEDENGVTRSIYLTWVPTTPLEKIIGTNGQVLAAFDVRPLVGKPPSALKPALPASYIFSQCIDVSCTALGPTAPGGHSGVDVIQATFRDGETQISIDTSEEDKPRLVALLEASLGKLEPDPSKRNQFDNRIVQNGGITYHILIWRGVTIYIPHHPP